MTLTAFFVKATALALVEHPMLNASIDVAAGEIVLHPQRHIAVAVDTADGLVLPVVRDADAQPLLELAAELNRLGELARRRLSPASCRVRRSPCPTTACSAAGSARRWSTGRRSASPGSALPGAVPSSTSTTGSSPAASS